MCTQAVAVLCVLGHQGVLLCSLAPKNDTCWSFSLVHLNGNMVPGAILEAPESLQMCPLPELCIPTFILY